MTRKEAERLTRLMDTLRSLGFTTEEAEALRRISMTLHRWHELECGDSNTYGSWAIEREDNGDGPPYMVRHHYRHGQGKDTVTRTRIADKERGAKKRLAAILQRVNVEPRPNKVFPLEAYIQTDPRGAALYIIRPGDVPAGENVDAYYNRGICVY
jgi:hypothetical protein